MTPDLLVAALLAAALLMWGCATVALYTRRTRLTGDVDTLAVAVGVLPSRLQDHHLCEGIDCRAEVCYCGETPCVGSLEPGCPHPGTLCERCWTECPECVLDARHDSGASL